MTGNGIASITKTGTSGLVDTYTITYTNGNTTTFTITNGEDGEVTETELEELRQQIKDLEANQITNTPTPATELYLNDSADARFRKFIPIGRSVQDGDPTPENPVPIKNTGDNVNLFDINNETFIKRMTTTTVNVASNSLVITKSDASLQERITVYKQLEPNTTYKISTANTEGIDGFFGTYLAPVDSVSDTAYPSGSTGLSSTATTNSHGILAIIFYISTAYTGTTTISKIKLEQGTKATPYSPYGCGNVNEKVQNKNLAPFTNQDFTVNNVRYYVENGSLYFNGTSTIETSSNNINFKNNLNFILEAGTYKISHKTGVNAVYLYNYDNDSSSLITLRTDTANASFTLTQKTKLYIGFYVYQKVFNNVNVEIQIEKSSTATSYVPHEEQNISFPLAQGQKLMQGDYLADDGVHHVMKETRLGSSNNFYKDTSANGFNRFIAECADMKSGANNPIKCSHLVQIPFSQTEVSTRNKEGIASSSGALYRIMLVLNETDFPNEEALNTWLSNNDVKLQYPLAEEVIDPYTEEQQIAWEEIKKARTYKNITHISSEDETPANVELEYVRDLETVINNLSN